MSNIQPTSSKTQYAIQDYALRELIAKHIGVPLDELEITFVQYPLEFEPMRAGEPTQTIIRTDVSIVHDHLKKSEARPRS